MEDIYLSNGNKALPSTDEIAIHIFNIPAISIRDKDGNIDKAHPNICVEAPEVCKEICYAYKRQKGREKIVYGRRKQNYDASLKEDFVEKMKNKIDATVKYYQNKDVSIIYRIHESGDFYSIDYLKKWVEIANNYQENKKVIFMAYTKNIEILDRFLKHEKKTLKDINIKFRYSVMNAIKHDGKAYQSTKEEQPEKYNIALRLKKQGLSFYSLYENKKNISENEVECALNHGATCIDCEMKCYLTNDDIAAIAR